MEGKIKITPTDGDPVELEINMYNSKLNAERNAFKSFDQIDYFLKNSSEDYHNNKLRGIFEIFYNKIYIGYFSFYFSNIDFNRRGFEPEIQTFLNLDYIAIDKNYQRQKIGSVILKYIIAKVIELSKTYNCISGIILTPLNNEVANFYKNFGFVEISESDDYILIVGKEKEENETK